MSYYSRNADKLKERFRRRYNTDPLFREEHKKRVAAYKKKRAARRKDEAIRRDVTRQAWKTFVVGVSSVECCRIGVLAAKMQRSVQTVRLWERTGMLPKTIVYQQQRWYTRPHVEMMLRLWTRYHNDLQRFFEEVRTAWNKINNDLTKGSIDEKRGMENHTETS